MLIQQFLLILRVKAHFRCEPSRSAPCSDPSRACLQSDGNCSDQFAGCCAHVEFYDDVQLQPVHQTSDSSCNAR